MPFYECEANEIAFITKHVYKLDFHQSSFRKRQIENTKHVKYIRQIITGYHPEIESTRGMRVPAMST